MRNWRVRFLRQNRRPRKPPNRSRWRDRYPKSPRNPPRKNLRPLRRLPDLLPWRKRAPSQLKSAPLPRRPRCRKSICPMNGRLFEKGRPFIGQIDFLHLGLRGSGADFNWLGARFLHGSRSGRRRSGRRFFRGGFRGDFGYRSLHRLRFGGLWGRRFRRRDRTRQFRIRQTSGTLEAAAQFPKSFGAALVARLTMDLFQLRGEFGGAPVVTCAEDEVEQFFECRRVARRAAQNGLKQTNGFLRESVAGEQVDVGERLRDELLCLFVERRLGGRDWKLGCYFGSEFFLIDGQLGSRGLENLCLQVFLGKLLRFTRRQEPHFAEHAIEFALCRIALRIAIEKLFESLLCSVPLMSGNQGIPQMRQRVGQTEGIACASVKFHEPFQRPDAARHACRQLIKQFPDNLVLSGINHRKPRLFHDLHSFFGIPRLQQRFHNLLHRPKIFLVRFKYAMRERRSLVPIGILEIKVEEEFGLFATLLEIGRLFQKLGSLGEIAL